MEPKVIFKGSRTFQTVQAPRTKIILTMKLSERESCAPHKTIDLKDCKTYTELSIIGEVFHSRMLSGYGQIRDSLLEVFPDDNDAKQIASLWNKWHLNGMRPGIRVQQEAVKKWVKQGNQYSYDAVVAHLKSIGLYEVNGYSYGAAWLVQHLPSSVLVKLENLFEEVK